MQKSLAMPIGVGYNNHDGTEKRRRAENFDTMDTNRRLKHFSEGLTQLSQATGVPFSWHFANPDHLRAVPEEQRQCWSRFCLKTRSRHNFMLDKCLHDHRDAAFRTALLKRDVFTLRCHAGAELAAIPFFAGDEFVGILFAGPFAGENTPAYPGMNAEYRELPPYRAEAVAALGQYLKDQLEERLADAFRSAAATPLCPQIPADADTRILKAAHLMRMRRRKRFTAVEIAADIMEHAMELPTKLEVDGGFGHTWYDAK